MINIDIQIVPLPDVECGVFHQSYNLLSLVLRLQRHQSSSISALPSDFLIKLRNWFNLTIENKLIETSFLNKLFN